MSQHFQLGHRLLIMQDGVQMFIIYNRTKLKLFRQQKLIYIMILKGLLPIGDPECIFVTVAMGVFIEHLAIAAAPLNVKVELVKVYDPITTKATGFTLFAKLKLVSAFLNEELNRELILQRRTARSHYTGNPLATALLAKIKNQSQKFEHDFFYATDENVIDFIVKLNQQTLFEDLSSSSNRKELDHLFRYTEQEAKVKKDGLWSRCMGFRPIDEICFS